MPLLAIPLGLIIGLALGALGGGGSVLAVPALIYLLGQNPVQATTGSLIIVIAVSLAGLWSHARAGHVRWRSGTGVGLAGVVSAGGASLLAPRIDESVLLIGFAALILSAAVMMWREPKSAPEGGRCERRLKRASLCPPLRGALVGLLVGIVTGLFGVGGGFLAVPALVIALGMDMTAAVGTSLLVIGINSAVALAVRLTSDVSVDWIVIAPFAVAGVLGALAGERIAGSVSSTTLQRGFAVLLIALAIFVGIEQLFLS